MISKITSKISFNNQKKAVKTNREKILFLIKKRKEITKYDVQEMLNISHSSATSVLSFLQDDGLIFVKKLKKYKKAGLVSVYALTPVEQIGKFRAERELKKKRLILMNVLRLKNMDQTTRNAIISEIAKIENQLKIKNYEIILFKK